MVLQEALGMLSTGCKPLVNKVDELYYYCHYNLAKLNGNAQMRLEMNQANADQHKSNS